MRDAQNPMKGVPMKKGNSEPLSEAQKAELAALAALDDSSIDTSDAEPVKDWSGAKRGVFYRVNKQLLSLRLDADLIEWFRSQDKRGYQTRINAALREYVERHQSAGL